MDAALSAGTLDVVGVARPLCTQPGLPRALLAGYCEAARFDERSLRIGGGLLGPASRSPMVRAISAQAQTAWFYKQILLLAEGKLPDASISAFAALRGHFVREFALARARRKAASSAPGWWREQSAAHDPLGQAEPS